MQKSIIQKVAVATFALGMLLVGSLNFPTAVTAAPQCRKTYPGKNPSLWRNRTAAVTIKNTTKSSVEITLYHPDSGRANGTWIVPPKSYVWVPSSNYIVGDDWGIQMNSGCIYYIDEITTYRSVTGGHAYHLYVSKEADPFQLDGYLVLRKDPPATEE